jgi:wyosine [tRNA(Phe)-imidazoG37] synthetase (radical SAM superfamily)
MNVFGPIPPRRLGRSLGVNNIPPEVCSYSCVYCQVGLTDSMSIERKKYFSPEVIVDEVKRRVNQLRNDNKQIDYISFVPDGEPTLDINPGKIIGLIKPLEIKIAVITNSSPLWDKEVWNELMLADWVSLKIDSVDEKIWHRLNRSYGKLDLQKVLRGVNLFRNSFRGKLVTEIMLVNDLNDNKESLTDTAEFKGKLNPDKVYILVPTRPTDEKFVKPPSEKNLNMAYQISSSNVNSVELLTGSKRIDFTYSDVEKELFNILAVHPMCFAAVNTINSINNLRK